MYFIDVIDADLTINLIINNLSQVVTNFEEKIVKKKNKCTAKKKAQLKNFCTFVRVSTIRFTIFLSYCYIWVFFAGSLTLLLFCARFFTYLSPYFTLISYPKFLTFLSSYFKFFTFLLFYFIYALATKSSTLLLTYLIYILAIKSPAFLLLCLMLSPAFLYPKSLTLGIFKQFLLNKP